MRPLLSMKTLYRSPVKTLLTFILLAVVTFALFLQTAEYAVTSREFANAARQYIGVGSVEITPPAESNPSFPIYINADPRVAQSFSEERKEQYLNTLRYQPLKQTQISAVSALPHITRSYTRFMTAGISDTFFRLDDGEHYYNYSARCVIEGTLTEVAEGAPIGNTANFETENMNRLVLEDCTLLAGNPPWAVGREALTIYADPLTYDGNSVGAIAGGRERVVSIHNRNYIYGAEYVKKLTPGSRYAFVARFEPLSEQNFYLSCHLTETWCGAVWSIDGEPETYLETEKFAPLRELIELTNADAHTFDIVYTDDMSAIPRLSEGSMAITEGRALTSEDSKAGTRVCVINREFAETNRLEIGDTITMKLGTELFEQYKGLGAVAAVRERYSSAATAVELEIVGIYVDTDGSRSQSAKPHWSYSVNTVFAPRSLLQIDEQQLSEHVFSPAEFSFKVENAWDIPAFLEETPPLFEKMSLRLIFFDDGWADIAHAFQASKKLAIIKILVLAAATATATGFIVYLFISRKKKEYAVMRALGTTRKAASTALLYPLLAIVTTAVLAGGLSAWIYTAKMILRNNTLALLKEYSVNTSVPSAVIVCTLGEILLALIIALALLWRTGSHPILSLLQDNGNRQANVWKKAEHKKSARIEVDALNVTSTNSYSENYVAENLSKAVQKTHKRGFFGFALRYIWRHLRRAAGKSVLSLLVAALLFAATQQFALMRQSYARLCENTVVTANFAGGLPISALPQLLSSGYFAQPYYESGVTLELNLSEIRVVMTNDIARYTGEDVNITYAVGYDESCTEQFGEVIIAGKELMAKHGLKLGDTVKITPWGSLSQTLFGYASQYRLAHPKDTITDDEILALYHDEIMERINLSARVYTIAGVVSSSLGAYSETAFTPGTDDASRGFGAELKLDAAEFVLADNKRANEARGYGEQVVGGSPTNRVAFIMDTSKLENLLNALRILEALYPIAVAAALLIGGFLCVLVIFQSSKEAAIMRVLGTTKRRTRLILALEQVLLSIGGLIIGLCGLLIYKRTGLATVSAPLSVFAALYCAVIIIAAAICSAVTTRRNILELLQTKE